MSTTEHLSDTADPVAVIPPLEEVNRMIFENAARGRLLRSLRVVAKKAEAMRERRDTDKEPAHV